MGRVVVHVVVVPSRLQIVYVCYEQALTRQRCVPLCLLTVVDDIILVAIVLVVHDVCLATLAERFHGRHDLVLRKLDRLYPACHPLLVACEASRAEAVAVVAAGVEQIPVVHAVAARVGGVVHVGKAETVRELVAYCAYTVAALVGVKLAAAGVSVHVYALTGVEYLAVVAVLEVEHVGPDVGRGCALVVLATTCVEKEHLVDISVLVPVVLGEVYLALALLERPCNELANVLV